MIAFAFRGTGIYVLFYFGLSMLIWNKSLGTKSFRENNFIAWTLMTAAVITAIHAFIIWRNHRNPGGHGSHRSRGLWHDSFLFIPVTIWPFVFGLGALYFFVT